LGTWSPVYRFSPDLEMTPKQRRKFDMLKSTTLIDTMKLETGKTFVEVGPMAKRDSDDVGDDEKLPMWMV
jgi:hypothetical protein